ncbi:hypothetical protein [Coleofasciculus sp. F4-SAH-05]|uniref:hypothetical protein n=1 Tax=Coleofasciculus sp. F4-SAH-05 TaxID=3069525 RepID=UPI0040649BC4
MVEPGNITLEGSDWVLEYAIEGAKDALYLCLTGQDIVLSQDDSVEFIFNGVAATDIQSLSTQPAQLRRGSTVAEVNWELNMFQLPTSVQNEEYEGQQLEELTVTPRLPGQNNDYEDHETINLEIVQSKGNPTIPLAVGFTGSNRVLNIEEQESSLQLRITNTSDPNTENSTIRFLYNSNPSRRSQLAVALEVGSATNAPWALGTEDDVNGITMSPIDSSKWQTSGPEQITIGGVVRALQWTFTPSSADVSLEAQETLTIDISRIKTNHPTGATKLYLGYSYVPGYQDGEFVCAIAKAPLVFYDYKVGIGTTTPEAKLHVTETIKAKNVEVVETVKAKKLEGDGAVFTKMILMWSGLENEIPAGWALCNGQNGTPDLREKFIVAAGGKYKVGEKGGQETVTLTIDEMPRHQHGGFTKSSGDHWHYIPLDTGSGGEQGSGSMITAKYGSWVNADYLVKSRNDGAHAHSIEEDGSNQPHENRPPYYALCFIMKVAL